jgi:hypothetical protein
MRPRYRLPVGLTRCACRARSLGHGKGRVYNLGAGKPRRNPRLTHRGMESARDNYLGLKALRLKALWQNS